jgi:outer membrane receptor for monomeric catechols
MVVQEHPSQLRQLVAFEARRQRGIGHFITRAQIEDRHPLMLSDMLRTIPGAVLINAENGRTSVRFARVARRNCPPQFFVDGIEVTGFSIDDMPPGDVEGVELYAGAAGLPPEYNRMHGTSICGTVIIWTRIPSTVDKSTSSP